MASIGLVGNPRGFFGVIGLLIAYRLASIGLVGNTACFAWIFGNCQAYRLASIGLVGNAAINRNLLLMPCLPIGFDRIGWKLGVNSRKNVSTVIRLPIGFDRIGWKHNARHTEMSCSAAYRLASIGLVGNTIIPSFLHSDLVRLTDWLRSDWLETG